MEISTCVGEQGMAQSAVRALASHQCGPESNPGADAICGLNLLLVLSLAPRGFSPGTPVFPSPQKPTFLKLPIRPDIIHCTSKSLFIIYTQAKE